MQVVLYTCQHSTGVYNCQIHHGNVHGSMRNHKLLLTFIFASVRSSRKPLITDLHKHTYRQEGWSAPRYTHHEVTGRTFELKQCLNTHT